MRIKMVNQGAKEQAAPYILHTLLPRVDGQSSGISPEEAPHSTEFAMVLQKVEMR
jgi:hypothetical protein